ncbi:MAG: UPF0175 family protein [Microscillaceae bacterium]|jgi:predicted HTH domain antitoxin|nr:UPF0175 family protein [Microscillaceae bacterium]
MQQQFSVNFPADLAFSLKMQSDEFIQEMQTLALVKLFELGKISSGRAAKILGISRIAFLDLLGKYQVSIFNDINEESLSNDIANA